MAYAEAVKAASAVSVNDKVRAVATRTGFVRVYDPTLGTATKNSANLPNVSVIATNSVAGDVSGPANYDDAAPWYASNTDTKLPTGTQAAIVGTYRFHLTPVASSPDASSVQVITVEPAAVVVVATGTD